MSISLLVYSVFVAWNILYFSQSSFWSVAEVLEHWFLLIAES